MRKFLFAAFFFAITSTPIAAAADTVPLYRGLFGSLFSLGLDSDARQLQAQGIPARAMPWFVWFLAGPHRSGVGHSMGGNALIWDAHSQKSRGQSMDVIIGVDPVFPGAVPDNVKCAVSFYAKGGWGSPFVAESGNTKTRIVNIDVSGDPAAWHGVLDDLVKYQTQIVQIIGDRGASVCGGGPKLKHFQLARTPSGRPMLLRKPN